MAKGRTRRGRPAKPVPRYPGGQPVHSSRAHRGETQVQIMATALAYRRKLVADTDAGRNEAGYVLGRMLLRQAITPRQHRAGCEYALLVERFRACMGFPPETPQGIDLGVAHGLSLHDGLDEEAIRRVANRHQRTRTAIGQHGRAVEWAVDLACVQDRDVEDVAALKIGLDALAEEFQIPTPEDGAA